jgi:hypothetical protein
MNWTLLFAGIGVGLAMATLLIGFVRFRREYPKRAVEINVVIARLAKVESEYLSVAYKGKALAEPYIATARIWARGDADITSASFDAGRAISIKFDRPILGMSVAKGVLEANVVGPELQIPAQLMHHGDAIEVSLVFDQRPTDPMVGNTLIDIPVFTSDQRDALRKRREKFARMRGIVGTLLIVMGVFQFGWVVAHLSMLNPSSDVMATANVLGAPVFARPDAESAQIATVEWGEPLDLTCALITEDVAEGQMQITLWYLVDAGWVADQDVATGTFAPVRRQCDGIEAEFRGSAP